LEHQDGTSTDRQHNGLRPAPGTRDGRRAPRLGVCGRTLAGWRSHIALGTGHVLWTNDLGGTESALKARAAAQQAIRDAENDIGEALRRLLAEKLTLKQSAELCELTVPEVRKLSRRGPRKRNGAESAG